MDLNFKDQVAIVTGAGNGLGRAHALSLASRGANVVVNDLGGARDGTGADGSAAVAVVNEITALGGNAMANDANVTDPDAVKAMVDAAMERWGRIDILVNNAGILRDKSFQKMDIADFTSVLDVHLMGSVYCSKAVWPIMQEQNYGRILMTTSSSGLWGNFGQSNYGAAKMGLVGLMHTLHLEGAKHHIHVNALAPVAGTRMLEDLMPAEMLDIIKPEQVSEGAILLLGKDAPSRCILSAGAGGYKVVKVMETDGIQLAESDIKAETIAEHWHDIISLEKMTDLQSGSEQTMRFIQAATEMKKKN